MSRECSASAAKNNANAGRGRDLDLNEAYAHELDQGMPTGTGFRLLRAAAEIYINEISSIPDADLLLEYELADVETIHLQLGEVRFSASALKPRLSLQLYVETVMQDFAGNLWLEHLVRKTLGYLACDRGEGCYATEGTLRYVCENHDIELLRLLVDPRTRRAYFDLSGPDLNTVEAELLRISLTSGARQRGARSLVPWDRFPHRHRFPVVRVRPAEEANSSLLTQAERWARRLEDKFPGMHPYLPRHIDNYLREICGIPRDDSRIPWGNPAQERLPLYADGKVRG
ncbi:hypothetical protein V8J36_20745 [Frigidibacter sp. MR17.14]|uniref:hypothetical protein n=1 Tax=Frigidibacter sp. MR17.14 TaxID=3126509 RepID=UPI00301301BF